MVKIDSKAAFQKSVDTTKKADKDGFIANKTLCFKLFGATNDKILEMLSEYEYMREIKISVQTKSLDSLMSISFSDKITDCETVSTVLADVYNRFGDMIYADYNVSLAALAVDMLKIRSRTLAVAESLTGGLICSKIVEIAGASDVLKEGVVTYSNEAKISRLGVLASVIKAVGAVSEEVSAEMCKGLFSGQNPDYAISTTGIAGPGGATLTKPVGLCYISVGNKQNVLTKRYVFDGDRNTVREQAALTALFMLVKFAKSN